MQRSFAHQDPPFVVNAKFESVSALKHVYNRAALMDVYEFVPENVKPGVIHSNAKRTRVAGDFMQPQLVKRTPGKFERQFKISNSFLSRNQPLRSQQYWWRVYIDRNPPSSPFWAHLISECRFLFVNYFFVLIVQLQVSGHSWEVSFYKTR
jgi:hypothetical protein